MLTDRAGSGLMSSLSPESMASNSLMRERAMGQRKIFESPFQRLLICSIDNNFAGLEELYIGGFLDLIKQDVQMRSQVEKYIQSSPGRITRSLGEKLIRAAIELGDAAIVAQLLALSSLHPDQIVCTTMGDRSTAVERSAELRNLEVTRTLLLAGADPNKTYVMSRDPIDGVVERAHGALELAIGIPIEKDVGKNSEFELRKGGPFRSEVVDLQLVRMLVGKGARVDVGLAEFVVLWRDSDLIRFLIPRIPLSGHSAAFRSQFFMTAAVERQDEALAEMIVNQILQSCKQTRCGRCARSNPRTINRLLEAAAGRGFLGMVNLLVDYATDKEMALVAAIRSGSRNVIELLLKRGACVDSTSSTGKPNLEQSTTPLAEAIRGGHRELVEEFEDNGAFSHINEPIRFAAAVRAASEIGDLLYVKKLIHRVPEFDPKLLTMALHISIKNDHRELASTLLEAGAVVNYHGAESCGRADPPLLEALRKKDRPMVQRILECDVDMNSDAISFMEEAARWGDIPTIRAILHAGADVSRGEDEPALVVAVGDRNKLLLDILVKEHGAWPGELSLEAAASNNDPDTFKYLIDLGADVVGRYSESSAIWDNRQILGIHIPKFRSKYPDGKKNFGGPALGHALKIGDIELLNILLEAKYDVNALFSTGNRYYDNDPQDRNALGLAIALYDGRNLETIKKLIFAGADLNGIVSSTPRRMSNTVWPRKTALLEAISQRSEALVNFLITEGADIHQPARLGLKRTPLQYACEVGSLEIVELLLDKGAKVDEKPAIRGGGTSLQLCAIKGYCGIAERLLKEGADVHAAPSEGINGRSALDGAAENGRIHMLMMLWDAGAYVGLTDEQWDHAMKLAEDNGHLSCREFILNRRLISQGLIESDASGF